MPKKAKSLNFYLKTTTLHGVKHLTSDKIKDRWLWLASCCASTICAGVLCTVLWSRFFRTPTILIVLPPQMYEVPTIGVCSPPVVISESIINQMHNNFTFSVRRQLVEAITQSLNKRKTDLDVLTLLQQELNDSDISLTDAWRYAPSCAELIKKCRFRGLAIECEQLFKLEMTDAGPCCTFNPRRLTNNNKLHMSELTELNLMLNCSNIYAEDMCMIFTHYRGEEDTMPITLKKGFEYFLAISYFIMQDAISERLVKGDCISEPNYKYRKCMLECRERVCGCSDPLRIVEDGRNEYPFCEPIAFNCLRTITHNYAADECDCPSACETVQLVTQMQSAEMESIDHVIDPLYADLDMDGGVIVHLHLPGLYSRAIRRMRTESWLTLMSSLGGVFNMFMGFGLFSALEFFISLYIRLPTKSL